MKTILWINGTALALLLALASLTPPARAAATMVAWGDNASGSTTSSNAHLEVVPPARLQFCADFDSDLPGGISLFGNATVDCGYLMLTPAATCQFGVAVIDDFCSGRAMTSFRATFNALLFGASAYPPADGFSFNLVPGWFFLESLAYGQYEVH
jgi:hypothetical protein